MCDVFMWMGVHIVCVADCFENQIEYKCIHINNVAL
jgi:hypothetical protein